MPLNRSGRCWTIALCLATAGVVCLLVAAGLALHLDALKAAGLGGKGTPIRGLSSFVSHLKGNLTWAALTLMTLGIVVIGLMFMAGHSRAQDYAIKAMAGALIIVCSGGIIA